jgi:hypothetical protein
MITLTCKLNHVRYVTHFLCAVEIMNDGNARKGNPGRIEIKDITGENVKIQCNPDELFNLGFYTNALVCNSTF